MKKIAISKDEVIKMLEEGKIVFGIREDVNEPGKWIVGKIDNLEEYKKSGYWDIEGIFDTVEEAGKFAEELAAKENGIFIGVQASLSRESDENEDIKVGDRVRYTDLGNNEQIGIVVSKVLDSETGEVDHHMIKRDGKDEAEEGKVIERISSLNKKSDIDDDAFAYAMKALKEDIIIGNKTYQTSSDEIIKTLKSKYKYSDIKAQKMIDYVWSKVYPAEDSKKESSLNKQSQEYIEEFAKSISKALAEGKITEDDLLTENKFDLRRKLLKVEHSHYLRGMSDIDLEKAISSVLGKGSSLDKETVEETKDYIKDVIGFGTELKAGLSEEDYVKLNSLIEKQDK